MVRQDIEISCRPTGSGPGCCTVNNKKQKEDSAMEFLLSHWHCILPVIGIVGAMFFMRDRSKDKKGDYNAAHDAAVIPQDNRD